MVYARREPFATRVPSRGTMTTTDSSYDPERLSGEVEGFWKSHGLPPAGGTLGPPDGPVLHLFEGELGVPPGSPFAAYRAVVADVEARYLALVGRRSVGEMRWVRAPDGPDEPPGADLLRTLGVWTGGPGRTPWDGEVRHDRLERVVGRLARRGTIVSRDLPLRLCPTCGAPRSPERIIYQEEEGDTYLIRFDVAYDERVVHLLVWVDSPWKLLGATAILVHPDAPYALCRYRRKGAEELILTSRSSLDRFRQWIPDGLFEVLEERPGREFAGRPYQYPLRHEFPMGGAVDPPGGTVLAVADVSGTGTGIVPLVPGHGGTDAGIAEAHGIPGWPILTTRGTLDVTLVHKYAGLDLATATEFVLRDLHEAGAVFATLRVRRGVPHCMQCGTAMIWFPGRAWCLEPGRLPPEAVDLYQRLLPGGPPLHRVEVAPWPVSETTTTDAPDGIALLECNRCERLDALDGRPACPCGGSMYPVRRRLVPSIESALGAWARFDPFPVADSARLYLCERRRIPALIHQLAGLSGIEGIVTNVGLTVLPTLPEFDLAERLHADGADAVRAALVRTEVGGGTAATFLDRCAQERRRLARLWVLASEVLGSADPETRATFSQPVSGFLGELEREDRALLARWERTRVLAISDYDHGSAGAAHRRIFRFLETDLATYRLWTSARLALPGTPVSKRGVLRTLGYVLRTGSVLLGPIVPYLAESIYRRLTPDRGSLFRTDVPTVDRALLDDGLVAAWDRWRSFLSAVAGFRVAQAIAPEATIPVAAAVLGGDDAAERWRDDRSVLERIARIGHIDVGSPREPWQGRQRRVRPVESEIQRAYPAQASQIAHVLRRMPLRRSTEPATGELSVVIQGLSRRLLPSMVEYVETLPEGMLPVPWSLGELYLGIPGAGRPGRPPPPPLSSDAFWLARRVEHRLRRARGAPTQAEGVAIVVASDPLASELRAAAEPLAEYLGLAELRVLDHPEETAPPNRLRGRTRTGSRWWVDLPGLPTRAARAKHRVPRLTSRRVPHRRGETDAPPGVDYAAEPVIAQEESVRALNRELDSLLGAAVIGPAKLRSAWSLGFQSLERFRHASYEEIDELPGFGRGVAERLITAVGGVVPPRSVRAARAHATVVRFAVGNDRGIEPVPAPSPPATAAGTAETTPMPSGTDTVGSPAATPPPTELRAEIPGLPSEVPESAPPDARTESDTPGVSPPDLVNVLPSGVTPSAGPEPEPPAASMEVPQAPVLEAPRPGAGPLDPVEPPAAEPPEQAEAPSTPAPTEGPAEASEVVVPAEEPPRLPSEVPVPASPPETAEPYPPSPPLPTEAPATPATVDRGPVQADVIVDATPAEAIPGLDHEPQLPSGDFGVEPPSLPAPTEPQVLLEPPVSAQGAPRPGTRDEEAGETAAPEPAAVVPSESSTEEVPSETTMPPPGAPAEAASLPEDVPGAPSTADSLSELPAVSDSPAAAEPAAGTVVDVGPSPAGEVAPESAPEIADTTPPDLPDLPPGGSATPKPAGPAPPVPVEAEPTPPPGPSAPASRTDGTAGLPHAVALSAGNPPLALAGPSAPTPVPPAAPPPVPEPPRGGIELVVGSSIVGSLQPFLEATSAGLRGVCVVRESPERIRAQAGSRPVDIYWLTNLGRGRTLKPNDLPGLASFFQRQLESEHTAVFFIEGIEYLTRLHGVENVTAQLQEVDRMARAHEARVWLHVTPELLRERDLERIVATFSPS